MQQKDTEGTVTAPTATRPHDVAERLATYGPLLNAREMATLWQITVGQFYRLARLGAFDVFKVIPTITPRCYSKALVTKYLVGDAIPRSRLFGRKRAASR